MDLQISSDAMILGLKIAGGKELLSRLSKDEQKLFEDYLHNDASPQIIQKLQRNKDYAEGFIIGFFEGVAEARRIIASNMLALEMPINVIAEVTGLTESEILSLK